RNPETGVEEQQLAGWRGLRPPSIEQLPQPFGVDKFVVVRKTIDRQGVICCPHGPTILVSPDARMAQLRQPGLDRQDILGIIAVEGALTAAADVLRVEQPFQLGIFEAAPPTAREGDSSRDAP